MLSKRFTELFCAQPSKWRVKLDTKEKEGRQKQKESLQQILLVKRVLDSSVVTCSTAIHLLSTISNHRGEKHLQLLLKHRKQQSKRDPGKSAKPDHLKPTMNHRHITTTKPHRTSKPSQEHRKNIINTTKRISTKKPIETHCKRQWNHKATASSPPPNDRSDELAEAIDSSWVARWTVLRPGALRWPRRRRERCWLGFLFLISFFSFLGGSVWFWFSVGGTQYYTLPFSFKSAVGMRTLKYRHKRPTVLKLHPCNPS